jgi:hypothetical protein
MKFKLDRAGAVQVRVVIRRGGRVLARSAVRRINVVETQRPGATAPAVRQPESAPQPAEPVPTTTPTPSPQAAEPTPTAPPAVQGDGYSYTIPPTTKVLDAADVLDARPGPSAGSAELTLGPHTPLPVTGGHLMISPSAQLPYGMLARVAQVGSRPDGTTAALLEPAAISEVLSDVRINFNGAVTPELVDAHGNPVEGFTTLPDGRSAFRASASFGASRADSPFECTRSGGIPANASDVWKSGSLFPVELTFENMKAAHFFDDGFEGIVPMREPTIHVALSGEAVASIGFEANTGFSCKLSDAFRRDHRLRFKLPNLGPIPVNLYLEPGFEFGVSAGVKLSVSKRHYFSLGLEKTGGEPLKTTRAFSHDPPRVEVSGAIAGKAALTGNLLLLLGGGVGSANARAGLEGTFGPEVSLSVQAPSACLNFDLSFKASLKALLELWDKRWRHELASLTWDVGPIFGPKCVFDPVAGNETLGTDWGPAKAPLEYTRVATGDLYPLGDGRALLAERQEGSSWRYTVVSESGLDLNSWTAAYSPLSVVSAPDGTAFILGIDTAGSDRLHLIRVGPGGSARRSAEFDPSPIAPGMQSLALTSEGRLFWLYSLAPGTTQGIAEVDPVTLQRLSSKRLFFDNGGITPTSGGLVAINWTANAWRIPYESFIPGDDSPGMLEPASASALPSTSSSSVIAVGADGTVAELDFWPYDCAGRSVSRRSTDGTSWARDIGALLGDQLPAECEVHDADVLPDGDVVVTLSAASGVHQLRITPDGQVGALTTLADSGGLVDTIVDADGSVFTAFTRHTLCAAGQSNPYCVETRVSRVKDDVVRETAVIGGSSSQVGRRITAHVGQPGFAVGKGQVLLRVTRTSRSSFSEPCRRSCSYGGESEIWSVPMTARMSGRSSYSWWGA